MTKSYFIGIDGGGTLSRLVAIDKDMNIIGSHICGPTNITSVPYEKVFGNIQSLLSEFNAQTGTRIEDCRSICIGVAGAKTSDNASKTAKIFRDLGFWGNLTIMNDAELVLIAETKGEPGLAIIAGTGSVGFAMDHSGDILRVGGWGHIIDDGGSGYRIGMDAIKATLMDFDGRGAKTALTDMIKSKFELEEIPQILGHIYTDNFNKSKIAEIALLVSEASSSGDIVAQSIEQNAADNLVSMAKVLIQKARLNTHKIVLSGSIILHNQNIRAKFCHDILADYPNMQIVCTSAKPEMGAAYLALKQALNTH